MAQKVFSIEFTDVTVNAGATKTVAAVITPTDQGVALLGVNVGGDSTSGSVKPTDVKVFVGANDGSATSKTPRPLRPGLGNLRSTANVNYTTEPTYDTAEPLFEGTIHPQVPREWVFPPGSGREIWTENQKIIGLVLTNKAAAAYDFSGSLLLVE